jgi:hypothetical protein
MIVDTPWYEPNTAIRRVLQAQTVKEEIRCYSYEYSARLMDLPGNRRLRGHLPNDLPTKFPSVTVIFVILVS